MAGILSGMRIVEGSAFVAAPLGGMTLAQLGADVIRFDPIGGGIDYRRWPLADSGDSLYWVGLNKGKRSIAIDVRSPEGRELATALITADGPQAGLFLTNFPGTGWLDYERLRAARADLIMLNVLGNHDGSSAVDYTVNCAVGFPAMTGRDGAAKPVNHVMPGWDVAAGLTACVGLLAAERHRRATGEGQLIRLPLSDVALAVVGALGMIAEVEVNGAPRPAYGNDLFGAFGRDFPTRDGRRVMVAAISPRQWQALVATTGMAEKFALVEKLYEVDLRQEGDRFTARDGIAAVLGPWIAARTLDEVRALFDAGDVLWGPYQDMAQLLSEDARASTANPLFGVVDQAGIGPYRVPRSTLDFAAVERLPALAAPALGQHTDEVLSGVLGLPDHAIGDLRQRRVVA
ncbi:mesaconyl-CoA C1-C4 CoA transferase [Stella humosa]|uniref:Mesaconyl-CoA C1-C4 CoA transferase n=1 Tax=Stella humosa TaxID=94 RepID=A0A3N1MH70_9PROT|nr:CoA transferase [Stella humosa]ROQ01980.1 mesaconyl-CoA C1-C4 CoA transferase [Stella humosa]BBK32369.1 2-methylfumaryl-CoA isomerase [Stella humosa]